MKGGLPSRCSGEGAPAPRGPLLGPVVRFLAVQDAAPGVEVEPGVDFFAPGAVPVAAAAFGQLAQGAAGVHGGHLVHAGALGDEEFVEGVGDGWPGDGDAVAAHDEDAGAFHGFGEAVALGVVEGGDVAALVDLDAVVQQEVVVVGESQPGFGQEREGGQVLRVDVQDAGGGGVAQVDAGVDVESDFSQFALAAQDFPVQVADDEFAGGEFLEQEAAGVDEELRRGAGGHGEHERVVVADLLVPAEARRDAEDGGHVAAHLPFEGLQAGRGGGVKVGHGGQQSGTA